ncbi:LuxR C-terminal-related transcriptional regulator [Microbacterium aurum]
MRFVVITGDPGVGKSFLLDRVAAVRAAPRVWGVRALAEVPLSALAHLVAPASTRIELIRRLLCTVGPVICVDDFNDCDPLSQSLIERMAAEPERTVVATVRTERGLTPDVIEALLGRAGTRVVAVPELTREESDELVRSELPGDVSASISTRSGIVLPGIPCSLCRCSGRRRTTARSPPRPDGGAPRAASLCRDPCGRSSRPAWMHCRPTPVTRPSSSRDSGGGVPVGRFTSDRAVGLQTLLTNGLVTIEDRGDGRGASAGFTHPLFAETVWERTDLLRQREILTEHLAAEHAAPAPDAARIAVLSLDLDGRVAPSELMPALRLAAGGLNASVVLRFTTAAIARAKGDDLEEAVRAEAGALVQLGRVDEAFEVIRAALRRLRPSRAAVRLTLLLSELMVWAGGDQPGAARVLREQRRRYPSWVRLPRAAFAVAEADGLVYAGQHTEALELLERRARPWDGMDPELAVARATVRSHALAQAGEIAEAMASLAVADAASTSEVEVAPVLRSLVMTLWGAPGDGERIAIEAHRVAWDAGFVQGQAFAALAAAVAAEHRGDPSATLQWADRSATAAEAARMPDVLRLALLRSSIAQATSGRRVDPATTARLDAVTGGVGFFRHQVPLAHAWASMTDGDLDAAHRIMAMAVDDAQRDRAVGSLGLLLHHWMRMGRIGLADALAAVPLGSPLADARLALARGLDAGDPVVLLDAAEQFERHGMPTFAAEAIAVAARYRPDDRARLLARARSLAASVGSPSTPLLTELSEAAPLTRRERQIAELARDHRSAEIAAILHLSVRTVENHLARAFKKLGISSRAELPSQSDD